MGSWLSEDYDDLAPFAHQHCHFIYILYQFDKHFVSSSWQCASPNPPWKKKYELQYKEHNMINSEKSKGIWDVRVCLLFEDSLITESIALWNASEDCRPLHFPRRWQGISPNDRQCDRQGVACSLDNLFLDYPSSREFKNNRVLHQQHCYMSEEWWGFWTKKRAYTLHLYEVVFFSQSSPITVNDTPVLDVMTTRGCVRTYSEMELNQSRGVL